MSSKARCGVTSSSTAPASPPPRLISTRVRSGMPSKDWKSRRQAQALASVPGSSATVLEALATTEGRPTKTMAGMVTKEPPPAAAFIAPASRPAANRISEASMRPAWTSSAPVARGQGRQGWEESISSRWTHASNPSIAFVGLALAARPSADSQK